MTEVAGREEPVCDKRHTHATRERARDMQEDRQTDRQTCSRYQKRERKRERGGSRGGGEEGAGGNRGSGECVRYVLAAEEAVRRELVAGVGGVVGEMLASARLTLLKLQVNL